MKKSLVLAVTVIGFMLSGAASAASYTFDISNSLANATAGTDSNGLDHHLAYAWRMSGFNLGSTTITGATLTFTNFRNYQVDTTNRLFVYIAATSLSIPTTPGSGALCTYGCTTSTTGLADYNTVNGLGTIVNHTTYYTDDASVNPSVAVDNFTGTGSNPLYDANVSNAANAAKSATVGHTAISTLGPFNTVNMNRTTFPVTFTTAQVNDLQTYIGSGANGDFALLLDSDCHYYFDDIQLTLTTSSPVPEPGSIFLLMTVVGGVCLGLRKKKATTPA